MEPRIGMGYDIHRLVKGRPLWLGGVKIPHTAGLLGHSDGDVLIHAVVDALLGASGEGDIGGLFPDTDTAYRDIASAELLRRVVLRLQKRKMRALHIDTVVVAQTPKLAPHVEAIKDVLCPILGVSRDALGIKAKTNEGLGLIGRERAIACWAVALVGTRRAAKA